MHLIKNKIISLIFACLITVVPQIVGNVYKIPESTPPKFKTKNEITMEKLEEKSVKKNRNSFLYMISPDKGKVWTYRTGEPNHLIVYTVERGDIVSEEKILYKKAINWLDSFNSNIASEVFLYGFVPNPPIFRATIQKNRKLGGERGNYELNDMFFPSLEQIVMFVDSFPQPSFYENLIRRYQIRTKSNDVPEGFEKPIDHDPFLTNLSRDICDYIFPGITADQ